MEDIRKNSNCSFVGGEWVETEDEFEVVNPATAEPFAKVSRIGKQHVVAALHHAEATLPSWRALTAKERQIVAARLII